MNSRQHDHDRQPTIEVAGCVVASTHRPTKTELLLVYVETRFASSPFVNNNYKYEPRTRSNTVRRTSASYLDEA